MATRKIEVAITGDSRDLERAFRRSGKSADTFGRKLTRGAGKGMLFLGGGVATAAIAGLAGVSIGMVKSAKAAADADASYARLTQQLKLMGKNTDATKKQIGGIVDELALVSGFDDEEIQDAFTRILRVTDDVAAAQKAAAMATDLAASQTGMTVEGAGKIIARVMAGNVGAIKRFGIAVEKGMTPMEVLGLLQKKVGGQAAAFGQTSAGAMARLQVASENLQETIGQTLSPVLIEVANAASRYLPVIAASLSESLKPVVAWLRANWPTIKTVIITVFDALKVYYQSVVIPVTKGIITAIGAVVSFVRAHMPQIRAAAQATFGWIETNIIPTVRAVAQAVQTAVATMTRIWREHGNDIKAVVSPIYNTLKTIITSALVIVRESVEFWLALIRGDFGAAFGSLKTIVSTAFRAVLTVMSTIPRMMFEAAKIIGREIVEGIVSGLGGLYGRVKTKLESDLRNVVDRLNPFSPVQHGGVLIATRLADGIITGLEKNRAKVAKNLSATVRQAVYDARGNLGTLTGGLAGMLGTLFGETSAEGKRLREIRAQQKREEATREKARLEAAVAAAETDEERAQAQQDLNDWLLEQEAQSLEDAITNRQTQYEKDIANLTASFNDGVISAQQFRDQLSALVGGATGQELGYAFASEFGAQLEAVVSQIAALAGFPTGAAGPGVTSPAGVKYEEDLKKWQDRKKALEDALADARADARKEDSPGKKNVTKAEQDRIDAAKARLDAHMAKRPKRLAMGGVLRRAVLAGEAGPEAVLPLSSGRAQRMLADAMDAADRINGRGGGTTVVNVTVNGNEFSAREFARKLKPELDRVVGFGTV